MPLKRTALVPRKFVPVMTTVDPLEPLVGVKLAIDGHPSGTVKLEGLDAVPFGVVTVTGPLVAFEGTLAEIRVFDSTVKMAEAPLNRTVVAPDRLVPVMVTLVP